MSAFSCFVVGKSGVALECLEILKQAGHSVLGVYSADRSLQSWTAKHNVSHSDSLHDFCDLLCSAQYDYLFSINNGWIIPPDVIVRARKATINYHNSPLPKYAGLHATSWALLNGETEHAIVFHEVVADIDAGQILKRAIVPIQFDDTALSLNTRCTEIAIAAFAELVDELAHNRVQSVGQDLSKRSYFGQSDRPSAAGLITFKSGTTAICNLVRALDFRPLENPLGLPKLRLPNGIVCVNHALADLENPKPVIPGTVLSINDRELCVATIDGAVRFSQFTTINGQSLTPTDLIDHYQLQIGEVLPELSNLERQNISDRNAAICRYERQWIKRLAQLTPFVHPYLSQSNAAVNSKLQRFRIPLADSTDCTELILALFAAYCARLTSETEFDVGVQTIDQRSVAPEIFAQSVPLRVQTNVGESIREFSQRFEAQLSQIRKSGSYAIDVLARYPQLRHCSDLPVAFVRCESPKQLNFESLNAAMAFVAYSDGSTPEVVHSGAINEVYSQAIVEQLQTLIAAGIRNLDQPISTLPLLSNREQKLRSQWNQTDAPYPQNFCIHELITQQAHKTPDAIAVCCGDTQLSYQDLDRQSNQVAHWLQKQGVKPDTLVALCVPRSVETIVGLVGILKAGGAYVAIDPTYPIDRIRYLIQDSAPQAVVTVQSLRNGLFDCCETSLCLDDSILLNCSTAPICAEVAPEHLAYVIYTSGSTGKPKGVAVEHRSIVNHAWAIAERYELGSHDRVLHSASISFDVAAEQLYPALIRGATVVVQAEDLLASFARFSQIVEQQTITVLILPTAFWHEWTIELAAARQSVPDRLRIVSVGTEKVSSQRLAQWDAVTQGQIAFFQGYGPTEATITCTLYQHDRRSFNSLEAVPIGRALPNVQIHILDSHRQPVPVGIVGEIYIAGVGLARGYHRQPERTRESFIRQPDSANQRLYKTGDFARFNPDGQIVYCDRGDRQIKLNGFRIELDEVEAVFNKASGVKRAVVDLHQPETGARCLVAYVVLDVDCSVDALKQIVQRQLPSYMMPSIVVLDAIPLTANGKLDRTALPAPAESRLQINPRNDLEQQIADLWKAILGVDSIGVTDLFFELGGHSLAAVRLLQQIEQRYDRKISLITFLQAPTIEQLARHLGNAEAVDSTPTGVVPIQPNGSKPPLFAIHILGKGYSYYRPLTKYLPDRAVYGLAVQLNEAELTETGQPSHDIRAIAARYVESLKTVQPQGPYHLIGISFGGMVAFEMAQQLQAQGESVALLALMDTASPIVQSEPVPLFKQLNAYRKRLLELKPRDAIGRIRVSIREKALTYPSVETACRWMYRVLDRPFPDELQTTVYMLQSLRSAQAYTPQPYPGQIMLFFAKDQPVSVTKTSDPRLGWAELADELHIYEVPGDHLGMLQEPNVQVLAQQLKRHLNHDSLPEPAPLKFSVSSRNS